MKQSKSQMSLAGAGRTQPQTRPTNIVSLLIRHPEGRQYLMGETEGNIFLPSGRIFDGNWLGSALDTARKTLSYEITHANALKLVKVWYPLQSEIHNIIYGVDVTHEQLKRIKIMSSNKETGHLKWMPVESLQKLPAFGQKYWRKVIHQPSSQPSKIRSGRKQSVKIRNNFIKEFIESDFIVTPNNTDSAHYEFLIEAGISHKDQCNIYKEFLSICWPDLMMSSMHFLMFLERVFGRVESKEYAQRLFRTADVYNRNCLSFRDVLYIFAACDPETPHYGIFSDMRCRYIFRYYDQDQDAILTYKDFREIVKDILEAKGKICADEELDKETEMTAVSFSLSPESRITLYQFLSAVGELKIRGTSALLRFKKGFKSYFVDKPSRSLIGLKENSEKREAPKSEHHLAVHTLKFKNMGASIDVDELWSMGAFVSPSSIRPLKTHKLDASSTLLFRRQPAVAELLNGLRFFSQADESNKKQNKEAYSWGQEPLQKFGLALIEVCNLAIPIFAEESRLLELDSPIYVLGDVHGNFPDLIKFERVLWHLSPTLSPCKLLFLGDYVDRGAHGVEVVAYMFAYKIQNPEKLLLLRGNHEIRDIQKMFTFYSECIQKFGPSLGNKVWTAVNNVFDVLPIAALIDNQIFCCHGGIPPPWLCASLATIKGIPSPLPLPDEQSQLAWNLMWNDPARVTMANVAQKAELQANVGFARNTRRGTGYVFNQQALNNFLSTNGLTHLIRAHEMQIYGVAIQLASKLISVFSTSDYCGAKNDAACIFIDSNKIRILRMESSNKS